MSGIKSNSSNVQVVSSGAKWTGVVNMKVVAINPTKAEMEKMGMQPKKDPEYFTETAEKKSFRLDVFLYNAEKKISAKVAFFLENKVRWNQANTKVEWINKFGQTSWSSNETDMPNYDWFKKEGARPAYVGEATLTSFIAAWANTGPEDQATFDNIKALATGDLTEFKSVLASIPNNEVQVLLGVKQTEKGYFQDVYTGYFDRPYSRAFTKWVKALESDYGSFKSDYQGDLNLRIYEKGNIVKQDTPTDLNVPPSTGGETTGGYKF